MTRIEQASAPDQDGWPEVISSAEPRLMPGSAAGLPSEVTWTPTRTTFVLVK